MRSTPNDNDEVIVANSNLHNHDVLCGRGGQTNSHVGNIWFRKLVISNRPLYQSCPKHTKIMVAKAIVQAVQQQNPPGRFVELFDKEMKLWRQISYKKCVDKASQALREKNKNVWEDGGGVMTAFDTGMMCSSSLQNEEKLAPLDEEIKKMAQQAATAKTRKDALDSDMDLSALTNAALMRAGLCVQDTQGQTTNGHFFNNHNNGNSNTIYNRGKNTLDKKRKPDEQFIKPSWWGSVPPLQSSQTDNFQGIPNIETSSIQTPKRVKLEEDNMQPLPLQGSQKRQSSLFQYLGNTGFFGRRGSNSDMNYRQNQAGVQGKTGVSFFSFANPFSGGNRFSNNAGNYASTFNNTNLTQQNANNSLNTSVLLSQETKNFQPQSTGFGGFPTTSASGKLPNQYATSMPMGQQKFEYSANANANSNANTNTAFANSGSGNNFFDEIDTEDDHTATIPPQSTLTSQLSDWFAAILPKQEEDTNQETSQPYITNLERSVSSSIFGLARAPSQFLTNLKSGVSSMFGRNSDIEPVPIVEKTSNGDDFPFRLQTFAGEPSKTARDSLLDDYEETDMEIRLRTIPPRPRDIH